MASQLRATSSAPRGKTEVTWAGSGQFGLTKKLKRQRTFSCNARAGEGEGSKASRRDALNLGVLAASSAYLRTCLDSSSIALADDAALDIFWGAANPPATYGGTASTTKEFARYSFLYPEEWKEQIINKVEKGTNGTDCRLTGSPRTKEQIYIVVLQRLGEDLKGYKVNDVEKALSGIAVADAKLQDALAQSETKTFVRREVDGQVFFDLDLNSISPFYITLTNDGAGRYFAAFITANAKGFAANKELYAKMRNSFRTYVIA